MTGEISSLNQMTKFINSAALMVLSQAGVRCRNHSLAVCCRPIAKEFLLRELIRRGVSKETVEAALVKLFQTSDTTGDQEDLGKWGMTTEAAEHLIAQARRRWHQADVKIDVKRRRMIGWLQRRGFPWSIIPDVLRIIETEETT